MTAKTPYTIAAGRNGQTSIRLDTVALHAAAGCRCYGTHGNDGAYKIRPAGLRRDAQTLTATQIVANLRTAFPGASIRLTIRRIIVRPSVAMLDDVAALDGYWQEMAAMGATHAEMLEDAINRIEYRRHAAPVAVLS